VGIYLAVLRLRGGVLMHRDSFIFIVRGGGNHLIQPLGLFNS
jgi:hypothetical protein